MKRKLSKELRYRAKTEIFMTLDFAKVLCKVNIRPFLKGLHSCSRGTNGDLETRKN